MKNYLLKSFMLVCLLMVGMGAWADEATWTAASGALGSAISSVNGTATGTISTGSYSWSYTRTLKNLASKKSDYIAMSGDYLQIGSSNAGENVVFTTSNVPGIIQSVEIDCGSSSHSLTVTVGGTPYSLDPSTVPAWSNSTGSVITASGNNSGTIEISFNVGTAKAALYLKSIKVTYTTSASTVTLSDGGSETEASAGAGVTLPSRSDVGAYKFAGWSTTNIAEETTTSPIIIPAGKYYPPTTLTLYPVYKCDSFGYAEGTVTMNVGDTNYGTWTNSQKTSTAIAGPVTFTAEGSGANDGKYYSSDKTWRFYTANTSGVTISVPSTMNITEVEVNANATPVCPNDWTYNATTKKYTTETETNSVSFMRSSSGLNFTSFTVTYEGLMDISFYTSTPQTPVYTDDVINFVAHDADEFYYATFSNNMDVFVEASDIVVYAVSVSEGALTLNDEAFASEEINIPGFGNVTGTWIPANTGALIMSTEDEVMYWTVDNVHARAITAANNLRAASVAKENDGSFIFYMLNYAAENAYSTLGFYWGAENGGVFASREGGAYLAVPRLEAGLTGGAAKGFAFNNAETDGIENVEVVATCNTAYNLNGQRVNANARGIVIVNGKKMLNM